ncbi:hypothetical protein [uncultured Roseobacter sp.]|uniref:hypothetical protein n=1 Tax=uncultured Roseobacter sp. TaxID=114847 RepID=UPI002617FA05|nr:hypothetical protein [uncultured Roseobacter sp.]
MGTSSQTRILGLRVNQSFWSRCGDCVSNLIAGAIDNDAANGLQKASAIKAEAKPDKDRSEHESPKKQS